MSDVQGIDEQLVQKLTRQIKILNGVIIFFVVFILVSALAMGFLAFKVVTFIRSTEQKVTDIQNKANQTLNVQDDLCSNAMVQSLGLCKTQ